MRLPLDYVITLNGKVFIKDGEQPESRIDIKYEKQRPTEIKMLTKLEAETLIDDLMKAVMDSGFNDLTEEQKRAIITLNVNKFC